MLLLGLSGFTAEGLTPGSADSKSRYSAPSGPVRAMSLTSRQTQMAVLSVLSLLVMAYVDYATGFEVIFSAAYLLPAAICAWNFRRSAVWAMAAASGFASWFVDRGHIYSHQLIEVWNAFMCFVITLVAGLVLQALRHTLTERQRTNRELQAALDQVRQSNEEILKLQSGLQTICAWTNQVKVGDTWMKPEDFLTNQLHLRVTHGISPQASESWLKAAQERPPAKPERGG